MYNVSNNAATKLVGVLGVSDTELTVQDGSLFPSTPFLITLYKPRTRDDVVEIIRVNTKDGNVFSDLERGYEGTTTRAWDDTVEQTYIENRFTAGTYQKLKEILEGLFIEEGADWEVDADA